MDVKQRNTAQYKKRNLQNITIHKPKLKPCPFCGGAVVTSVSNNGYRFFNCPTCGATVRFEYSDAEGAIRLWNEEIE